MNKIAILVFDFEDFCNIGAILVYNLQSRQNFCNVVKEYESCERVSRLLLLIRFAVHVWIMKQQPF